MLEAADLRGVAALRAGAGRHPLATRLFPRLARALYMSRLMHHGDFPSPGLGPGLGGLLTDPSRVAI